MHGSENIPLNFDNPRMALVQKHGRDAAKNMFSMASNTLQDFLHRRKVLTDLIARR